MHPSVVHLFNFFNVCRDSGRLTRFSHPNLKQKKRKKKENEKYEIIIFKRNMIEGEKKHFKKSKSELTAKILANLTVDQSVRQ